jgi:cell division protein FtsZ
MEDTGSALMGIGRSSGDTRATEAAKSAIESPLLDLSIDGARGILFTIAGSSSLSMHEVNEAAKVITDSADPNAKIIFGAIIDDSLGDELKITVIATGFERGGKKTIEPTPMRRASSSLIPDFFTHKENEPEEKSVLSKARSTTRIVDDDELDNKQPKDQDELDIPAFIRKKIK